MNVLARIFFWGYSLMLTGVGASGILIARWELAKVFGVPMATLGNVAAATLLNQYRFLKAVELAFGIFCIAFRSEIFRTTTAHRVFLAGVFAGVVARLGSWIVDGKPSWPFLAFAALELVTGIFVALAVRGECVQGKRA
ncbi:MAG TPA: DUF4345 family protein [Casimicrobiaceae bacterium]